MVMMTGRLVHHKGSLARAVLPFVVHLRWGWHRVERAMEHGKVALDAQGDRTILIIPLSWFRTGSTAASAAELEAGTRAHASVP